MGRKRVGVRIAFKICFTLVFLSGASTGFGQTGPETSIAKTRAKHLQRGINLSEWFAQVYDAKRYTKEHFENWNTVEDIALIKALRFDHVRLSGNPKPRMRRADQRIPVG